MFIAPEAPKSTPRSVGAQGHTLHIALLTERRDECRVGSY